MAVKGGRRDEGNPLQTLVYIAIVLACAGFLYYLVFVQPNQAQPPPATVAPTAPPVAGTVLAASPTKVVLNDFKYSYGATATEVASALIKMNVWHFDPRKLYVGPDGAGDTCSSCYSNKDNLQNNLNNRRYLPGSITLTYTTGQGGTAAWGDTVTSTAATSAGYLIGWINNGVLHKNDAGKYVIWLSLVDLQSMDSTTYFYNVVPLVEGTDFTLYNTDRTTVEFTVKEFSATDSTLAMHKLGSVTPTVSSTASTSITYSLVFSTASGELINPFDKSLYQGVRGKVDFVGTMAWNGTATWNSNNIPEAGYIPGSTADMWFQISDLTSGASLVIGYSGTFTTASSTLYIYAEPELNVPSGVSPCKTTSTVDWFESGNDYLTVTVGKQVGTVGVG